MNKSKTLLLGILILALFAAQQTILVTASPSAINLLSNGDFESDVSGWNATQGSISQSNEEFKNNSYSLKVIPSSEQYHHGRVESNKTSLGGDVTYYFSAWAHKNISTNLDNWATIGIYWYSDGGDTWEGTSMVDGAWGSDTGWNKYTWSGSKAAGADTFVIYFHVYDSESDNYCFFIDDVYFGTENYSEFNFQIWSILSLLAFIPATIICVKCFSRKK